MRPTLVDSTLDSAHYSSSQGILSVNTVSNSWPQLVGNESSTSLSYLLWQKTIDLLFGLLGTGLLLLLLPFLAPLMYLDSPGPIFYSQIRLGLRGKPFRIYKFRSMHADKERERCEVWATQERDRVTRIGRFLRATHMDELPQVVNILRGDMSLIGPRPERELFAAEMEAIEPTYRHRLAVKPGLTGLAQVMYGYGNADSSELQKLSYDLYYIQHRSWMLDMGIIVRTVGEVVFCHGV